jgi:hypothetical protein
MRNDNHGHPDERISDLFVPDTMLPSQYFDRLHRRADRSGEHRLMLAILEDAVDVYRKQAGARDPRRRALFDEAESWIESADKSWIYTFENICDVLSIDASYLRRGLHEWKRRAVGERGQVVELGRASAVAQDEDRLTGVAS